MSGDAIGAFFTEQSARVRGGKFFRNATTADAALARAKSQMGQWSGKSGGFKYAASKLEARATEYAGRAWIAADDGAARFASGLIGLLGPAFEKAFAAEVLPWARHVIDEWPVDTGKSKSAIALDVDTRADDALVISLVGGDPKTFFVAYAQGRDLAFDKAVIRFLSPMLAAGGGSRYLREGAAEAAAEQFNITKERVQKIWYSKDEQRTVYRLPGGGDAAGKYAWVEQARKPFAPMVERMSKACGIELSRSAGAFTARSK